MTELQYTLISDGSSDAALIPILTWLLVQNGVQYAIQPAWADMRYLPNPPRNLIEKVALGIELYPCDLLFIHRDAEAQPRQIRLEEIEQAIANVNRDSNKTLPPKVCVVPIRMTEAWLLLSESAIRLAAGNESGPQLINLPSIRDLEGIPDPKALLHKLLTDASGYAGRRLRDFNPSRCVRQVSAFTVDFTPLRSLSAFSSLERDLQAIVREKGWDNSADD
jgi:hypothetical protein